MINSNVEVVYNLSSVLLAFITRVCARKRQVVVTLVVNETRVDYLLGASSISKLFLFQLDYVVYNYLVQLISVNIV